MVTAAQHMTASVQTKKGRLYAVIVHCKDGKRKYVWRSLDLPEGAPKSKVAKSFKEVVDSYERQHTDVQISEPDSLTPTVLNKEADIPIYDFMDGWLEKCKLNYQINTYLGYNRMIQGQIKRYFSEHKNITVGNITSRNIEAFYETLYDIGNMSNTVCKYHALLRKAFQYAYKHEIIDANPFDRVDRPKIIKYNAACFSEEEWRKLMNEAANDNIYPVIVLAGGLGLRRSEALGVRWSRIDFAQNTVLIDTKVVEKIENNKTIAIPIEQMKNVSSRRTIPLTAPVIQMLNNIKEMQGLYKEMFKGSYNKEFEDYVCVDPLGNLLRPGYVTAHFPQILQKVGLKHIRFHDLRHTFASMLLSRNVPLIDVSNFLGHSTISTTANIYGHLDKSSKIASAKVISQIFNDKKRQ